MTPLPDGGYSRLEGLDLARYLAFVGMVVVNFRIVMGADSAAGGLATVLEGRAAATFVVLAGIGLGRTGGGLAQTGLAQTLGVTIRRAAFLWALGLVNMTVFDADILHYYAFYFLIGAGLLPLGNRALIGVIAGLNIAFVTMVLTLNYDAGWDWDTYSYTGFWTLPGFVRHLFFNGWHPVIPWLSFLLLGVVLSRLTLASKAVQGRLLLIGLLVLAGAELTSGALSGALGGLDAELAALVTTEPVPPMPLYLLAGGGAACAVVGACLRVAPVLKRVGLLDVVTPAGRQTLTLYIAHILIGMGVLEAMGLTGQARPIQVTGHAPIQGQIQVPFQAEIAALVFCAAATAYAFVWARAFKRGPVETIMRRLAG